MLSPDTRQMRLIKGSVFVLALMPLVRLVLLGAQDRLSANPIEFITRSSGDWTLYFLCITLAVTPLRRLSGWSWLLKLRRMLGLFTFFYACLHFTTFIWFDHFFDLPAMWTDILKRPFIAVGASAFVLLIPLADYGAHAGTALAIATPTDLSDCFVGATAFLVDASGQTKFCPALVDCCPCCGFTWKQGGMVVARAPALIDHRGIDSSANRSCAASRLRTSIILSPSTKTSAARPRVL